MKHERRGFMKKKDLISKIHITLPEDYKDQLDEVFDDEFTIAQEKWGVKLNEYQREKIYTNSFLQWQGKASYVSKNPIDLTSNILTFNIRNPSKIMPDYTLPKKYKENPPLMEIQVGWVFGKEEGKPYVLLNDFYDYVLARAEKWLRTAVFYGVGSYAG